MQCGLSSYFETLEFSCVLLYQTGSQIASTSASFSFPGLTGIITVQIPEPSKLLHIPVSQEVKPELAKSAHSAVAAWHPASLRPLAGGYVTGILWVCDFFFLYRKPEMNECDVAGSSLYEGHKWRLKDDSNMFSVLN